jgi:hypothetical protein
MSQRALRIALVTVDAFTAVTAVAGGVVLVAGREAERFPVKALRRMPFTDHVLPGWLFGSLAGGSAAVATVATLRDPRAGGLASMAAGTVLVGWVLGGEPVLDLPPRTITDRLTDAAYLTTGTTMVAVGMVVRRRATERDPLRRRPDRTGG